MTHIYAMAHNCVRRFASTTAKIYFSPLPIDEAQFAHGIGLVRLDFDANISNPITCNIDIEITDADVPQAAEQIRAMSNAVLSRRPSGGYLTVAETEALLGVSLSWIAPYVQRAIVQYIDLCNQVVEPVENCCPTCGRAY